MAACSTRSSSRSARSRSSCAARRARSSAGAPSSRRSRRRCSEATGRLAAVTLEGEPGIGKTRLLLAAAELATASGFTCVAITADEEIRGPFLVARSLFASDAIRDTAAGTPAEVAVRRVVEAISGRDEPGFESLSPDAKLLRAFDLAGVAIAGARQDPPDRAAHRRRPVGRRRHAAPAPVRRPERRRPADLPVPDHPAGRVRDGHRGRELRRRHGADGPRPAAATRPIRSGRDGGAAEARARRAGRSRRRPRRCTSSPRACRSSSRSSPGRIARRARSSRSTASGGSAATRRGSSPRRSGRSSPAAPRACRRGHGRPSATRRSSAGASACATFVRSGARRRRRDRVGVPRIARTDDAPTRSPTTSSPRSRRACCSRSPQGGAADYTFTHEQVRQFAVEPALGRPPPRRSTRRSSTCCSRAATPPRPGLPMLAQHALAAGDTVRAARFSIDAATAALGSNAPEEALRLVEQALPVVSSPADRRTLLVTRDDAYRRPAPDRRAARRPDASWAPSPRRCATRRSSSTSSCGARRRCG